MTTLAEAYAAEGLALPKPPKDDPEHRLQVQLRALCREHIACRHKFAAHDRTEARGHQHMFEKEAGQVRGWPDVELCLMGGKTVRIELKAAGKKIEAGSEQERIAAELNALCHPTCWADSAVRFVDETSQLGVPWRGTAWKAAQAIDAFLAEAARQHALDKPARKGGKPRQPRPSPRALVNAAKFQRR